ncbi:MAG: D-aminoacyl-tRNA deacylase [Candidatus Peribacteraceae bacterium]|jgi:D-tyrosyl-tRNA(Tyr) deacylase
MRIVLQRVKQASVTVSGETVGSIGPGYLLLLCAMKGDTEVQADWLAEKVSGLRLFDSPEGKINDRSILEVGGEILVVSQFTLSGDVSKGRRPDYTAAAGPGEGERLYKYFIQKLQTLGIRKVENGRFGAMMDVTLTNDGPVTLLLERS